jgi:hypothetical protein
MSSVKADMTLFQAGSEVNGQERAVLPNARYSAGMSSRFITVAATRPPRMTSAIGYSIS